MNLPIYVIIKHSTGFVQCNTEESPYAIGTFKKWAPGEI